MSLQTRAVETFARLPPGVRLPALHLLGRYAPWESGFDFTPPALRPGEVAGPPDFVGIGAQKAGTTWWFGEIARHPDVYSRTDLHKERHFFDRFGAAPFRPSDAKDYHGWFPRISGTRTGEWTPDYLSSPWVPPLLQAAAPDVRILVLLRDPIDRFRSGRDHQLRMGQASGAAAINDAVERGFYHRALVGWLAHVDRSRLLVQQYERCALDPAGQLRQTFTFLGLDDHGIPPAPPTGGTPGGERPGLDPELCGRLVAAYEDDVSALAGLLPDLDLTLWPHFAHLAAGGSTGAGENSPSTRP